jgi:2'-5' RNA ligase
MTPPAGDSTTICAFLALELPKPMQAALAEEISGLEKEPSLSGVEWIDPRKMHLTLRFLGWTTRDRLACLDPYLVTAAKACPPLDATVSGLGTFPPTATEARVLWAGITIPRSGKVLQAACEAAAIECGFPPERRAFLPHLTLGRFRTPSRLRTLPKLDLGSTRLENLVLYRSQPGRSDAAIPGVRRAVTAYSKLASFPLG